MTETCRKPNLSPTVNRYVLLLAAAWTLLIAGAAVLHLLGEYKNTLELARIQASDSFEKDLVYRRWAAGHGGVYVPTTEETPPNPYLSHIENRDVTTTSGLDLTLLNPAYMTRQVHELGREQYGHEGHITSLNPLRPENAPDPWEAEALRAFQRGETEVVELVRIRGKEHLRLMRPMITEETCLRCHADQGYQVGDLRGGISVSVPMAPLWTTTYAHMASITMGYGLIWLLGLGGIGLGASRMGRRIRERDRAEEALRKSEALHAALFEHNPIETVVVDRDGKVMAFNKAKAESGDRLPRIGDVMYRDYAGEHEIDMQAELMDCIKSGTLREFPEQKYDGKVLSIKISAFERGAVITSQDITDRKRADEALRESEGKTRAMLESLSEHMSMMDKDLNILWANDVATGLFGDNVIGKKCYEVYHGRDKPCEPSPCLALKVFEDGQTHEHETQVQTPDGRTLAYACTASVALRDDEGNPSAVIEVSRDITEQKRAEEALAENDRYFRTLLNQLHEDLVVIGPDYRIVDINNMFMATTGYTRDEVVGRHCYEVSHGYSEPCEHGESCFLHEVFATGEPFSGIHHHLCADGSKVWLDVLFSPLRDGEGNVTHVIESARDVTDLMFAQEALLESEEKYRQLFTTVPDAVMIFDGETRRFVEVNQSALDLYGYSREEFLQLTQTDITAEPEASDASIRETLRIKQQHIPIRYHKKRDGTVFPVEISTNAFNLAGRQVVCGALRDIAKRLQAEEALQEREQELSAIYDNAPILMLLLDHDRRVRKVNRVASEMTGRTQEEMIGVRGGDALRCIYALDDPAGCGNGSACDRCVVRNTVLDTLETGRAHHGVEATVTCQHDNRVTDVSLLVSTVRVNMARQNMALVCLQDITGRVQAEKEKRQLEIQFLQAQKMESIGRLAGGIAHDFNNLLTGLMGYTQLLQQQLDDNPTLHHDVGRISNLVDRAARLTRQLLAFGRRQTLNPVPVDLNDLITNSLKMLRRIIGEDIEIKFEPAAELETVRADLGQIDQILMNLAVNARDAMPSGGTIRIETANASIDELYLQEHVGAKPGSYVMLSVTDTGCGMNAETKDRIFEPFFTTKEAGQGTGLGLAVVYGIVKQHGGNIWVYSEPGKGTTFRVYLPRLEKLVEPERKKSVREIVPTGSETVLLVEDELVLRDVETRMLKDIGYTVLVSSTVREAEALFAEYGDEVDMLVSDVVLPDGYGPQLYKRLAEHKPGLKVLFASGYSYEAMKSHGIKDTDGPFLEKPFTLAALAQKIRDVLSTEQMRAEDEQNAAQQTSVA